METGNVELVRYDQKTRKLWTKIWADIPSSCLSYWLATNEGQCPVRVGGRNLRWSWRFSSKGAFNIYLHTIPIITNMTSLQRLGLEVWETCQFILSQQDEMVYGFHSNDSRSIRNQYEKQSQLSGVSECSLFVDTFWTIVRLSLPDSVQEADSLISTVLLSSAFTELCLID